MTKLFKTLSVLVLVALVLSACGTAAPPPTEVAAPTQPPALTEPPAEAGPAAGRPWIRPVDAMEMVYVPAGEFPMGSEDGGDDEKPVHTVALDAFWIDRYEVSNEQFGRFVAAEGYRTDAEKRGSSYGLNESTREWEQISGAYWQHPGGPDSGLSGLTDHPVVHVSWNDAEAYCAWAGVDLPTEAQWEYAARGPEGWAYPWGNTFDGTRVNYCDVNCPFDWADKAVDDGYVTTAPVGTYPQGESWTGALDLAGNVWEWVADWYAAYPSTEQNNPSGPSSGEYRLLRGGSWDINEDFVRGADRYRIEPGSTNIYIGFRCARGSE